MGDDEVEQLIDREEAVTEIGQRVLAADAWVVLVPPDAVLGMGKRLHDEPVLVGWCCYLDIGQSLVLAADTGVQVMSAELLSDMVEVPMTGVLVLPKTLPRSAVAALLQQGGEAGLERDLICLDINGSGQWLWPVLFVDAMERVDSRFAAAIRADAVAR